MPGNDASSNLSYFQGTGRPQAMDTQPGHYTTYNRIIDLYNLCIFYLYCFSFVDMWRI